MQKYKDDLRTKKRKKLLIKVVVFGVFVIAGMAGIIYLLFFAKLMDVRSVSVEVGEELRADIDSAVDNWLNEDSWQIKRRNNLVFLSGHELTTRLLGQFSKLESVRITKKLPHSIVISGQERKSEGIWCSSNEGRCFYFDKNGIAFSEAQPSSGFLILNVVDQRTRELKLGETVIGNDWLVNILKARELLMGGGISVAEFTIAADSFDEFYSKTAEGWRVLFSNQTNIAAQINSLITFLKEKLTNNQRASLEYIDLRIQDRIYYK